MLEWNFRCCLELFLIVSPEERKNATLVDQEMHRFIVYKELLLSTISNNTKDLLLFLEKKKIYQLNNKSSKIKKTVQEIHIGRKRHLETLTS